MNDIIPIICGSTLFFGTMLLIVFGFFGYMRYLRYRETLILAEKGLLRVERSGSGKGTLRWGIVITALGFAMCLGLYPLGWMGGTGGQFPLKFGPWMLVGLIPTFFGLALVLVYYLTNREMRADEPALAVPPVLDAVPSQPEKPMEPELSE
jgi:hypothetical protein